MKHLFNIFPLELLPRNARKSIEIVKFFSRFAIDGRRKPISHMEDAEVYGGISRSEGKMP
jgi:hypothetical protein